MYMYMCAQVMHAIDRELEVDVKTKKIRRPCNISLVSFRWHTTHSIDPKHCTYS